MPAAYTHTYIAHLVLSRLRRGVPAEGGKVRVFLPATAAGTGSVLVPAATVRLLLEHPASFCFGSVSPDFLPDVISGITTSHQPKNRPGETLASFMEAFGRSVRWDNPYQVAWLAGWFCHLCADVFGHHWVGVQADGDFQSWASTKPEVIRLHLGIEMQWADAIRSGSGEGDFLREHVRTEFGADLPLTPDDTVMNFLFFQRSLVLTAMLTDGAPLCERFYDVAGSPRPQDEMAQLAHPLTRVRGWRDWHRSQRAKVAKAKGINDSPLGGLLDRKLPRLTPEQLADIRIPCPLCKAHGVVTKTIERACPVCIGTGIVEDKARAACLVCRSEGGRRVPCAACEGLPDLLRDTCPECHGERALVWDLCFYCLGVREGAGIARSLCPQCKGARETRTQLDEACPFCAGQKFLQTALGDPAFSSRDLLDVVFRRLIAYHEGRCRRIDRLAAAYLEAGERLALLLLTPHPDLADGRAALDCYRRFLDEAGDFCASTLTLSDLAPELSAYGDQVRRTVEQLLALPMKALELVPPDMMRVYGQLKADVIRNAVRIVSEKLGSLLTAEEGAALRTGALEKYPPPAFPPVADAVTFFLLALGDAEPTEQGFAGAFRRLGEADNIDARLQPGRTAFFADPAFPWDDRFRLVKRNGRGEEDRIRVEF